MSSARDAARRPVRVAVQADARCAEGATRRILLVMCAVNGACLLAHAALSLLAPLDAPLALASAGASAAAVGLAMAGRHARTTVVAGLAAGACLVAWCAVELAVQRNGMAAGLLVVGLLQTAFAWQLRR